MPKEKYEVSLLTTEKISAALMMMITMTKKTTMMMLIMMMTTTAKRLQNTAVLGTAHIFRSEKKNTCTIHCNHNMAATLHTLDTWFVPGLYYL